MFNHEFDDSLSLSSFTLIPPPPLLAIPDQLVPCFQFDCVSEAMKVLDYPETLHDSSSTRSCSTPLQKDSRYRFPFHSTPELADAEDVSFPRVRSAGDLQRINGGSKQGERSGGSQLMSKSNMIIEGLKRTCRYSPEEKKERIERYRSKRTQRNFNKKIKYTCRKTLADSRLRIQGRFTRNDEIKKTELQLHWNHGTEPREEEEPDYYNNWICEFFDAYVLTTESN